ncbi:hypothetical protein QFZ30_000792 [Arthrobacter pascens]|uniref:hypothetical protein n=1 Tax=Arthrobacter pascens TaxID=1677 RepID=UPI00278FF612|nr:hypothetical protein [Arthrobacter pascens]MDQ0677410.1 hypothetical protein [Arthrobacter pascens]
MSLSRRLLFASAVWEVARPRTALTAGHLLIRLSNPAVAFDLRSAADWLVCHNAARQALTDVLGAGTWSVLFAHQWHPIGAAIGEPEAESSTPTFHLFGRWDGETVSPGEQLRLPAQRRAPLAPEVLTTYDAGLRTALGRSALNHSAEVPEGSTLPEVVLMPPRVKAGPHHTVLAPEPGGSGITPGGLLAVAAALQGLTSRRGVSGLSCVALDAAGGGLEIHALGRTAGEPVNPMERLLDLPEVSQALL